MKNIISIIVISLSLGATTVMAIDKLPESKESVTKKTDGMGKGKITHKLPVEFNLSKLKAKVNFRINKINRTVSTVKKLKAHVSDVKKTMKASRKGMKARRVAVVPKGNS